MNALWLNVNQCGSANCRRVLSGCVGIREQFAQYVVEHCKWVFGAKLNLEFCQCCFLLNCFGSRYDLSSAVHPLTPLFICCAHCTCSRGATLARFLLDANEASSIPAGERATHDYKLRQIMNPLIILDSRHEVMLSFYAIVGSQLDLSNMKRWMLGPHSSTQRAWPCKISSFGHFALNYRMQY